MGFRSIEGAGSGGTRRVVPEVVSLAPAGSKAAPAGVRRSPKRSEGCGGRGPTRVPGVESPGRRAGRIPRSAFGYGRSRPAYFFFGFFTYRSSQATHRAHRSSVVSFDAGPCPSYGYMYSAAGLPSPSRAMNRCSALIGSVPTFASSIPWYINSAPFTRFAHNRGDISRYVSRASHRFRRSVWKLIAVRV